MIQIPIGLTFSEGPVQWSESHQAWVVLDHAVLSEALRDGRLFRRSGNTTRTSCTAPPRKLAKVVELGGLDGVSRPPTYSPPRSVTQRIHPRRIASFEETVTRVVSEIVNSLPNEIDFRGIRRTITGLGNS